MYYNVLHFIAFYHTTLNWTALKCTELLCTILHFTALHCTSLHCTAPYISLSIHQTDQIWRNLHQTQIRRLANQHPLKHSLLVHTAYSGEYTVYCTHVMVTEHRTLHAVYCTLHTVYCTLHCVLYSVHYTLCTEHCALWLNTVHCVLNT